ncbi:transposase family protein [Enterococcus faecium]|nr:transposase family protein [Enterococcus faecium]
MNQHGLIVKNGKKKSLVLLNKCANQRTYLALAKQRYLCRGCHTYFTANTYIVEKTVLSPNKYIIKYWRN